MQQIEAAYEMMNWFYPENDGGKLVADGGSYASSEVYNKVGLLVGNIYEEVKSRYIELPKDADGLPIHFGDVMFDGDKHGEVVSMTFNNGRWHVNLFIDNLYQIYISNVETLRRWKPTVEGLLGCMLSRSDSEDRDKLIDEFASQLQLKDVKQC